MNNAVYNNALQTKAISGGRAVNQRRKAVLTVTHPRIIGVAIYMQHWNFLFNKGWRPVLYRLHPDLNTVAYLANFLC